MQTPTASGLQELPAGSVLVAVSGGADSIALLNIMHRSVDLQRNPLLVAHYHHGIRGEEADLDAAHVEAMAAALDLPFLTGYGNVPEESADTGESLEMAARRLRHAFLQSTAADNGCVAIATGHTADDQAETLFMRLARGASLRGAGGMRPASRHPGLVAIIRPLLHMRHRDLCAWLESESIPWREDATNADCAMQRNRIRNTLIPAFESIMGPASLESLARSMALFRDDNDLLESIAEQRWAAIALPDGSLSAKMLGTLPQPLFRRIISKWLYAAKLDPQLVTLHAVERIKAICDGPERGTVESSIGGRWTARRCGDVLAIVQHGSGAGDVPHTSLPYCFVMPTDDAAFGPVAIGESNVELAVMQGREMEKPQRSSPTSLPLYGSITAASAGWRFWLRGPEAGDRISPAGSGITQKISDILTNLKVPRHERGSVPLLAASDGRIAWMPGYAVDEEFAVKDGGKSILLVIRNTLQKQGEQQ